MNKKDITAPNNFIDSNCQNLLTQPKIH